MSFRRKGIKYSKSVSYLFIFVMMFTSTCIYILKFLYFSFHHYGVDQSF
jgi:hypothetical protein